MRVENGMVVLERKDCHWCDHGTRPSKKFKVCPKCHGTGKRGNGRCRNCNDRNGYYGMNREDLKPGYVLYFDHEDRVICELCDGKWEGFAEESWTDPIDVSFLPMFVIRKENRPMSWGEQYIGVGLGSCVDYGRHKNQTDDQLIAHERPNLTHVQACKIVRAKDNLEICEAVVIVTGDQGYSLVPQFS